MSRTKQIRVLVTSAEEEAIKQRAAAAKKRSTSAFLRSLGLNGELAQSSSLAELETRLADLQADLFSLKFLLEAELGVSLSRSSQEIEASEEPIAFRFATYAENLQSLYLTVMRQP
ncbi:MAG: hypothetical protein AAF773_00925 [Cyanobacteria bacterium P01_D01_bin.115]